MKNVHNAEHMLLYCHVTVPDHDNEHFLEYCISKKAKLSASY